MFPFQSAASSTVGIAGSFLLVALAWSPFPRDASAQTVPAGALARGDSVVAGGPRSGVSDLARLPQEPSPELTPTLRKRVGSADRIRVHLGSGEVWDGTSVGWAGEWLLLKDGRSVRLDRIARIDALHARLDEGTRWGAWVGGVVGAGLTGLTGAGEGESLLNQVGITFAGLAGGATVGAFGGRLVGGSRYAAEPVYAARTEGETRGGVLVRDVRRGPDVGTVRSRLSVTPYVGAATFGPRTERVGVPGTPFEVGLRDAQEGGLHLQYALGPRVVVRVGAAAIHTKVRLEQGERDVLLGDDRWLARGEVGLEFRMRADVPGYFLLLADGVWNPDGYILGAKADSGGPAGSGGPVPLGDDAGVLPRLGLGLGFDFFGDGDRRVRLEWVYRLGLYHHPGVEARGWDPTRVTRDATFSLGFHIPVVRPDPQRR